MLSFKTGRTPLGRYCLSGQILAGWIEHIKLFPQQSKGWLGALGDQEQRSSRYGLERGAAWKRDHVRSACDISAPSFHQLPPLLQRIAAAISL